MVDGRVAGSINDSGTFLAERTVGAMSKSSLILIVRAKKGPILWRNSGIVKESRVGPKFKFPSSNVVAS